MHDPDRHSAVHSPRVESRASKARTRPVLPVMCALVSVASHPVSLQSQVPIADPSSSPTLRFRISAKALAAPHQDPPQVEACLDNDAGTRTPRFAERG